MKFAKSEPMATLARLGPAFLLAPVLLAALAANAATDISNAPLFTSSAAAVKPNLMFILDDSGSMKYDYLPDDANLDKDKNTGSPKYGKRTYHCNGVAYNPTVKYVPPVDASGTSQPDASLDFLIPDPATQTSNHRNVDAIGAMPTTTSGTYTYTVTTGSRWSSGWYSAGDVITIYQSSSQYFVGTVVSWNSNSTSGTLVVDMTHGIIDGSGAMASPKIGDGQPAAATYYRYTGTQPDLGYTYTSTGVIKTTPFYQECNSLIGASPGSAVFTPVSVTSTSPEAQSYANWFQYYRTRMEMMKASISLAFKDLDSRYRVGYSTISEDTAAAGSDFLDIRDFDAPQKSAFYSAFNAAVPNSSTPLRGALSKAGQYFANKAQSQTVDPAQYACQRNFTILSTDGQWNIGDESSTYGPYKLDNRTSVGQQDGAPTLSPMRDGATSSDSLADVAAYYYNTDLRDASLSNCTGALGGDVCDNSKVSPEKAANAAHSFGDTAAWQHMTTFTLGLGVSGLLRYTPDYLTAASGDFFEITNGNKNWPVPGPSKRPENVDDLWHAAVDGHGQYFSAGDPNSLAKSLTSALDQIKAVTGAAAAASTSSLQPVAGDNDVYVAQFTTQAWTGDLLAFKIDPVDGTISTTPSWKAQTQLDSQASRTIYYPSSTGLKDFNYTNLTADSRNSLFDNFCSKTGANGASSPSQCSGYPDAATTTAANSGANLVAYLRGDKTLSTYYRARTALLGDIINASPLFVGKPNFKYLDSGYAAFATAKAGRTAVVLAAANDGMLHAFDRTTGNERWAFIPTAVMPNLYKLADESYTNNHSYFVDGSPQMGDIFVPDPSGVGGEWKTIVVGGLGGGGRSYYALDVTDPAAPKLLWEFSNDELGLTFGNPIITKRADGTWVVVFASGYNNVSPGNGNGHLFVLDAASGALLKDVPTFTSGTTPAGTVAQPSGLAKLNVWIDSDTNNLARRFYGADLLGNLWRFDIDDLVAPNEKALLLASMTLPDGTPQAVTVRPSLAEVDYNGIKYPVVYVATGKYLGTSDLADTTQQSVYAVKDPLVDASWGNLRTNVLMVEQTMTTGSGTRTITSNPVDWSTKAGWKTDLPGLGERVNVNPQLVLDTLTVGTNIPNNDACSIGGSSFLYKFDIATGSTASGESNVGISLGNVLVEGLTTVQVGSSDSSPGSIVTIVTRSDATLQTSSSSPSASAAALHRTSWRELAD